MLHPRAEIYREWQILNPAYSEQPTDFNVGESDSSGQLNGPKTA